MSSSLNVTKNRYTESLTNSLIHWGNPCSPIWVIINYCKHLGTFFKEGRHLAFLLGSPNILYSNYQVSCLIRKQDSGRLVWIQDRVMSVGIKKNSNRKGNGYINIYWHRCRRFWGLESESVRKNPAWIPKLHLLKIQGIFYAHFHPLATVNLSKILNNQAALLFSFG